MGNPNFIINILKQLKSSENTRIHVNWLPNFIFHYLLKSSTISNPSLELISFSFSLSFCDLFVTQNRSLLFT